MQDTTKAELRWRLRDETSAAHQELDQLVSQLDLCTRAGLSAFLGMQVMALSRLRAAGLGGRCAPLMDTALEAAQRDLVALGTQAPRESAALPPFDPLAVDYVISGASLGSKILAKRWADTEDSAVRAASRYFETTQDVGPWRAFQAEAAAVPPSSARADQICRDAAAIFALYRDAAQVSLSESAQHA